MTFLLTAILCLSFCLTCMVCVCVWVSICERVPCGAYTDGFLLLLCCRHNPCGADFSFPHFLCLVLDTKETVAAFWMFSSYEFLSCVNKYTCFVRLLSSLIPNFFFPFWKKKKKTRKTRTVTGWELLGKAQTDTLEGWFWRWGKMTGVASSSRKPFTWTSTLAASLTLQVIFFCPQVWLTMLFWE